MTAKIWQPMLDEPCDNAAPHLPHRNWRGAECGVCPDVPAVPAAKTRRTEPPHDRLSGPA
ncbi:hypothetical protein [Streptomyces sp. DH10]|uniref:hypothetical protein n=1 Tax=Streptomyces sp. DH10 TaxID=3040121 RepID=UPI002441708F|nr:hypothetical protein [Streptomyces sp. DH10]MDG9708186.1 hypothetical protein [Streptomyces sp. DH10]